MHRYDGYCPKTKLFWLKFCNASPCVDRATSCKKTSHAAHALCISVAKLGCGTSWNFQRRSCPRSSPWSLALQPWLRMDRMDFELKCRTLAWIVEECYRRCCACCVIYLISFVMIHVPLKSLNQSRVTPSVSIIWDNLIGAYMHKSWLISTTFFVNWTVTW